MNHYRRQGDDLQQASGQAKARAIDLWNQLEENERAGVLLGSGVLVGTLFARTPLRWLLALGAGAVLARALSRGGFEQQAGRETGREPPQWVSDPQPDAFGRLSEEEQMRIEGENTFPASDPPSYSGARVGAAPRMMPGDEL